MPKKPTTFSMRMPEDINDRIQSYAEEHQCTKAEAMSHFARAGMKLEDEGGAPTTDNAPAAQPAEDLGQSMDQHFGKVMDQLQGLSKTAESLRESSTQQAIVPADIRQKVQEYAKAHECSETEALGYYARLGIQMTDQQRPASVAEVANLSKKLDLLAKDSQMKSEQLKRMNEAIAHIRKNTEPETVEVEGELADPAIEEAKSPQLSEEEKERQEEERTRKIMTDVMNEYAAAHPAPAPEPAPTPAPQMSPWLPVLVAVIVSLVMGIVVILVTH